MAERASDKAPAAKPRVSVVIPCKSGTEALGALLADINASPGREAAEVIVVDAFADDAVRDVAEERGARVVRRGTGHLPGAARNLGAAAAEADILAFVDADCRVDPGWLAAAREAIEGGARIAAGPVDDLFPFHPVARADNLLQFADLPSGRPAGPLHMAPSCNFAVRAGDFRRLDGFRHRDGLSTGEDVDFCERALAIWPDGIRFCPGMAVRHAGRRTLLAMIRHHHGFGYSRGRLRLLLTDRQARLARIGALMPAVVLRRLVYIIGRVARLSPSRLPVTIAVLPLATIGAAAWAVGFRRGLRDGADAPDADFATAPPAGAHSRYKE
ncbi:MAG: glycosyltransferase [Paracoccaceae bacterium]|nr:glycosyltransferase [Paracoccaceae bacterium]